MGHRCRMGDKTLNPSKRFCERTVSHIGEETTNLLHATGSFETEHGSEPALLAGCNHVARMRRQSRIVYLAGGRSLVEPRSEEHTSEHQSPIRHWYAIFCIK